MWLPIVCIMFLSVTAATDSPFFEVNNKIVSGSAEVDPKAKTKFTCLAETDVPPPLVSFRLDGQPLKHDKNYTKRERHPGTRNFIVLDVTLMLNVSFHNKALECIVFNETSKESNIGELKIFVFHNITEVHINLKTSLSLNAGEQSELMCLSDGYPISEYSWFKNMYPVNESQPVKEILVFRGQKFIVGNSEEETGTYKCQAKSVKFSTALRSTQYIEVQVNSANLLWLSPVVQLWFIIITIFQFAYKP